MNKAILYVLLGALAILLVFLDGRGQFSDGPISNIIGGNPVSGQQFPFVVYIDGGDWFCSGSLVADNWVLTAAHCVVEHSGNVVSPRSIAVERGYPDDHEVIEEIGRIVVHPEYYSAGAGFKNDAALIELLEPFQSELAVPIQVLTAEQRAQYAPSGTLATAVGYGRKENNEWSDGMRQVDIPLSTPEDCRQNYVFVDENEIAHESTLCAGAPGKGINGGDSGGPLLVSIRGGWGQVGIASIRGRSESGDPVIAVYTRVPSIYDWITENITNTATWAQTSADWTITTFAGNGEDIRGFGSPAGDGGPAVDAQVSKAWGVAMDGVGNVFIADTGNHRIRKVDSTGTITTFAGTGEYGFSGDGGPAAEAQLRRPSGVAVDGGGNLFIADTNNHRIRLLTLLTPPEPESFSIPDRGGTSTTSNGTGESVRVGYGRIRADAGSSTPSGTAIFQFRDSEGVLISEAGVSASEPVQEGRIFAEVNGPVNTGLAIANPNDVPATIRFYFTDTHGTNLGSGNFELGANEQTAKFLEQGPFNGGPSVLGTFTFTSSVPVAVVALRGFINEAGEFLMTTLPVAPLSSTASDTVYFPHFADGSGWETQVVLVNPTDRTIMGTVAFMGAGSDTASASPAILTLDDGRTGSDFDYSIAPRSAQRFTTSNPPGGLAVGSVRATPASGHAAPSGLVVFSYAQGGKTVSEAGVPALPRGSAFRVYVEAAGMPGHAGSIRSGLAIANTEATANTVTLEVTDLDGTLAAPPAPLTLPPSGQVSRFIDELFDSLPPNFSGVLRVTSTADVAIVGLRLRYNDRGELKMTTTPPSIETGPSTMADRFFAHIVDSRGWSTQFILFSGTAGQASSGTLSFIDTAGEPWDLPTESSVSEGVPPGAAAVADLVVQSPTVTDASPDPGESFTFSATVRNQGTGQSAATTLRYYRSTDAAISAADTEVGTDAVDALTPAGTSDESISLTAPTTAGTYYYGACVDPVSGESDTGNNCSNSSMVTVSSASMAGIIPDANLRAAIEAALGKVSGAPITAADMETLTHLTARDAGVSDLTGLEFATNLTELQLDYNRRISDVSPLAGLTSLTELSLRFNTITDVSSLGGLPNLKWLHLAANEITDVSSLGGLPNLTNLELDANRITDVSVLGGLPNLTNLQLEQNAITDASGVGDLANLVILQLAFNAITDVSLLERLTNLQYLDLQGNPLSLTSINDRLPALERNGITVRFDRFRKGDFDIELVFVGGFIEGQKSVLEYAARRWMSVITEDLPDYEFTQDWSGTCGGQSIEIPAGERIDDLRIYVGSFEDAEGSSGYGGTNLLRESHLPIFGCMTFNSRPGYLWVTASHEVGHVLGFGRRIWGSLGFFQDPDGDQHFNGPLAIAAFDDAGGRDYSGKKVPVEGSHWRYSVLLGELMGPRGGLALSAITVQSLADLGYGVDVTQADAYTLPGAASAQARANTMAAIASIPVDNPLREVLGGAEPVAACGFCLRDSSLTRRLAPPSQAAPMLSCGLDLGWKPIEVVDQEGRIIHTIGN